MLKKILISLIIFGTFGNSFAIEISSGKKLENEQVKQIQNEYSKTFEKIIDKFLEKKDSKQLEELEKKINKINYKSFSLKLRLFIKTLSYKITKKIEEKIVKKGTFVKVHYIGKTKNDGKEFDNSYKRGKTLDFEVGDGQMIKGFDEAVMGMKIGEKKIIEIAPEDAYGKIDKNRKQVINKKELTDFIKHGIKLEVGNELPTNMGNFKIIAVDKNFITIDTNHPLVGKTLIFEIEMVDTIQNYREKLRQKKEAKFNSIKSDKPKVDLYVMSYCPYGTQAEKAILGLLDSKYINFNIKFVPYIMHGKKEGKENTRQYCIQKEEKEKFSKYLGCFLEAGNSKDCLEKNKIDMKKIEKCETETDKKYDIIKNMNDKTKRFASFNIDKIEAKKAGVQGSPTLVINGLKIDGVKRSERGFVEIICKTFKKAPEICKDLNKFSDKVYNPGFGFKNGNSKIQGGCGN